MCFVLFINFFFLILILSIRNVPTLKITYQYYLLHGTYFCLGHKSDINLHRGLGRIGYVIPTNYVRLPTRDRGVQYYF